jgi:hypothetical protein
VRLCRSHAYAADGRTSSDDGTRAPMIVHIPLRGGLQQSADGG